MLSALDVEPDGNLVEVQRLVTVPTGRVCAREGGWRGGSVGERDGGTDGKRVNNRI